MWQFFWRIQKRILDVDTLSPWPTWAGDFNVEVTFLKRLFALKLFLLNTGKDEKGWNIWTMPHFEEHPDLSVKLLFIQLSSVENPGCLFYV